ncbi:MAG TPA: hypothetical protein VGP26_14760 [Actinophytocola sp.]|nr:hypothetical protein [Actinophytocola sp.]
MTAGEVEEAEPASPEPTTPDDAGDGARDGARDEARDGARDEARAKPAEEPRAEPRKQGAEFDAGELKNIRHAFHVHNSFYAEVNAEGATFGAAGEERGVSTTRTGVLEPNRVSRTLDGFVRPPGYADALELLREHRILVLVGAEGAGKKALALHLLRVVCGERAQLHAASPARSLGQLAALTFAGGTGYLVADHMGSADDVAVRRFDADQLRDRVCKQQACLVLTTTSRKLGPRYLPSYALLVEPADPAEVLHGHLRDADVAPDVLATAEEFVRNEHRPKEIGILARRLVASPSTAVESMRDVPGKQVAAWFDRPVKTRELVSIAALAISGSQPESTHDALVRTLRMRIEAAREAREAAPHVPWADEIFEQRTRAGELVVVSGEGRPDEDPDEDGWLSGRWVRFRHAEYRELVLGELHERYDDQLWSPVRTWVCDLCRIDPREEIQSGLAAALAILARHNFMHVRTTFLAPWSNGSAPERMTAAMVLWFMSEDDRLAPVALRTALEWGENNGLLRGVTSALALSGPLGVRFMDEAMRRLCFLSLRAKRIGVVARAAVGLLLGVAVDDGPAATGQMLAIVAEELTRATRRGSASDDPADSYVTEGLLDDDEDDHADDDPDQEQYERGWNGRVAGAARSLVLAVLEAEQQDVPQPVAAKILCQQPEHAEVLGTLWAEALCSAPHRLAAIEALRRTLVALEHEPEAIDAVARLGSAIYTAMPHPHRPLRTAELLRAMTTPKRETERPAQDLVSTLLAALNAAVPRPVRS